MSITVSIKNVEGSEARTRSVMVTVQGGGTPVDTRLRRGEEGTFEVDDNTRVVISEGSFDDLS